MKKAVCVFTNNNPGISGYVEFIEKKNDKIDIKLDIKGLSPGLHGFHIHTTGDLRKGCNSLCSHFNPYNVLHGGIDDDIHSRHIGDLGNILVNDKGIAKYTFTDKLIKLRGKRNIIGRSVVIHELEDDLGLGGLEITDDNNIVVNQEIYNESSKTGNAGSRIACGVIGLIE